MSVTPVASPIQQEFFRRLTIYEFTTWFSFEQPVVLHCWGSELKVALGT